METLQTKVLTISHLTSHAGAFAWAEDGNQCYIPTSMRNSLDLVEGDKYFATIKPNYEERKGSAAFIAVRLHADHPQTVLVDFDDEDPTLFVDNLIELVVDNTVEDDDTDLTSDIDERDLPDATATRSLSEMRDQMFSILMDMHDAELSDMIIDTLTCEPMGFVDVLWSMLSISPIRHKDMNELQRRCYERVNNKCLALHQAGKLVQAKYTTFNHEGKQNTSVVYGTRLSQLDPTQV